MRLISGGVWIVLALCVHPVLTIGAVPSKPGVVQKYGHLPLAFERNDGQSPSEIEFLARGPGYRIGLGSQGVIIQSRSWRVTTRFAGRGPHIPGAGMQPLSVKSHYLVGNDAAHWRTDIPSFRQVVYRNVYPGIDVVYYGNQGQLEFDLIVAPGADPAQIGMDLEGVEKLWLDAQGRATLRAGGEDVSLHAPRLYQDSANGRKEISGRYVVKGRYRLGFEIGSYDVALPLTIDPVLAYATYLGGSQNDRPYGIAVDGSGCSYIVGETWSTDFPRVHPMQQFETGDRDVFVAKISADGASLVYATYLGGSSMDSGRAIAVDGSGAAYITGLTRSRDFPTTPGVRKGSLAGQGDVFVAKLNPSGTGLAYSTYVGGAGDDTATSIAVDSAGNAYVAGSTTSLDFPLSHAVQSRFRGGFSDAFVLELNPGGSSLVYSTYLGGGGSDVAQGVAVSAAGETFVVGSTDSSDFPTANPMQSRNAGGSDVFVVRLAAYGSALVYSTYLGGGSMDMGNAIAVDATGAAYITGSTISGDFPVTAGAFQTSSGVNYDAFVAKLGPDESLVYATRLGGGASEEGTAIAVDRSGISYIAGYTYSTDFPVHSPTQPSVAGSSDAFLAMFDRLGTALLFSTYLGGAADERATGLAIDNNGYLYVTGYTLSGNFPAPAGVLQPSLRGGMDGFLAKLSMRDVSPGASATAAFVKTDSATQGSWKGVYGSDGLAILNDTINYPGYAQVALGGPGTYLWSGSTADVRALQKSAASDRIAPVWFSGSSFTIDVNLTDGKTHQVALYCLDWEAGGRAQTIDVLDAASGTLLDTRAVSGFVGGRYLVWNLGGHTVLRVTRTAGLNAVVSGVFFN
ncbi:MAG: SBBP repeat-containing protein [Acidobacteriia bacterium]|nr:SBBP repeat-containing protein [Terriglobia bacterium]